MAHEYKTTPHPNSLLVFLCDVLAFAVGAGVVLAIFHWLAGMVPALQHLGLF